jgi:hypothetical protein
VKSPACDFLGFLSEHARVRLNDGSYAPFNFEGRRPLKFIAGVVDKIIRNCVRFEAVEIEGVKYAPGSLKGATITIAGGAQFGKTVLELNLGGYVTTIEFLNFGYYTSDQVLLATIVDTKFRPDVLDQIPWMAEMIQLNKAEGKSGKSVDRKNAFQASNGKRRAFGYFNGMQKPPTTISLDVAVLDEVDDIPAKNIGFVAGRMTTSQVKLTFYIGTQRIHGAGQNARWQAGTMHRWLVPCPQCKRQVDLAESWPGVSRVCMDGVPAPNDPKLDETMTFDHDAHYYPACPECGHILDSDQGAYVADHPERAKQRNWSFRVSQFDIPAIPWKEIVASWFAALADPDPGAMPAWHCDRRAIPYAGAAQPITPEVIQRSQKLSSAEGLDDSGRITPYAMTLQSTSLPRFAGLDTGPRCWLWIDEVRSPFVTCLSWAEMIASGNAFARLAQLHAAGAFGCIFIDAGGEPDLTKRIVLALNQLEQYLPPVMPALELRKAQLSFPGGLSWNGNLGQWRGIKAAAVEFSLREAGGIQQTIGFTQEGRIYPLIKANRGESIQGFVNGFLTPSEGVIEQCADAAGLRHLRTLPRQRLPEICLGAGVSATLLNTHLQNLRRVKATETSREDWADGVENHLGLAGTYARLAASCGSAAIGPDPYLPKRFDTPRSRAIAERRSRTAVAA